jgi:putative heme-binding domain-containing protein
MMRFFSLAVVVFGCFLGALLTPGRSQPPKDPYAAHIATSGPRSPEDERKGLHVPPGFEVQLVAAEPYVRKPININFDDRGRIWVTESVEYPFAAPPDAPHRDTVRILEATKPGEALADEITTFTSGLNIPIGVLPVKSGAIIYSIPDIYRFFDPNGDDRAVGREILYGTYGHKDTHGMTGEFTWGFDGWIYACHGFSNTSHVKGADGSTIDMHSGSTYRFKPDGSHVEYFTHGQVNPFGLTFDPLGNLYSCDCHSRPIYQLLRGAYYPSFGAPHDGLGFGPEVMTHDHGSTAIAGITYYAADHFPRSYHDTIFIGNVVTNRINHDRLVPTGSTVKAIQQPDFLISDDPWFRPVDIKLGPDGALYVADFYNRIIGHYEVPLNHPGRDRERGRIWRIVYRGTDGTGPNPRRPRADWNKATVAELTQDLAHPNLVVRMKATNQLVERGGAEAIRAVAKLMSAPSQPSQRMHGLWVLDRLGALDDATLERAAKDPDSGVRVHVMRVLAEQKSLNGQLHQLVEQGLRDADAYVRRCAADALGTHPAVANVRPLLDLRHIVPAADSHLLHVVRMALREQFRSPETWALLESEHWSGRDIRAVADIAPGVPTPDAAAFLLKHLQRRAEPHANQTRYVYHIARYAKNGSTKDLVAYARGDRAASLLHQLDLFKAIQQGCQARGATPDEAHRRWGEELVRKLLSSPQDGEVLAGIELAGSLKLDSMRALFVSIATDPSASEAQRTTALTALLAADPRRTVPLLGQALIDPNAPIGLRERAVHLLAPTNRPDALEELAKALPLAPERLAVSIANGLAVSRAGAQRLLDIVAAGKASPRLLQDQAVLIRLNRTNLPRLKERVAQLTEGLPSAAQRFDELVNKRRAGFAAAKKDPERGAQVFEKHCAICHQIANKGAKIGPQLDGIGIRGFERIFEDIVDPNRNVDQAFRSTTLGLSNGQIASGLLLREEGEVLVLADSQGKEVRVSKASVVDRTLSQLSPMPSNLVDQIPEGDFYNLLAFLLAQTPSKTPGTGQ